MADPKVLNTRISLKYDSYSEWSTRNPVLLKGEVAISTHDNDNSTPVTGFQNIPNIAMKVGDGVNHYNDLKFVSALAADVYGWAKAASKPTYTADEIGGLSEYISGEIKDTDTRYKLAKVEGSEYNYNLMSSTDGATYNTVVGTIDLSGVATRLKGLEDKVGTETVANQITSAINGLDMAKVEVAQGEIIKYVEQTDGIVKVEKRALVKEDIPTIEQSQVNGLGTALAAKQDVLAFEGEYDKVNNKVVTASALTSAIEGLDNNDAAVSGQFVTAVKEGNGIVTVERAALKASDIPTLSMDKIDGLDDALAALQEDLAFEGTYDAASNKVATESTVKNAIDGLDYGKVTVGKGEIVESIEEVNGVIAVTKRALKAEDIPTIEQDQVNGLGNALAAKQDELGFAGDYGKISNPVATKNYVDTMVADLNGAMHFEGKVEGETFEAAIAASGKTFAAGDVVLYGVAEYVYDGSAWHVLGNESIYALKTDVANDIKAAKEALQANIDKKQDTLVFNSEYNASSNKAATMGDIASAINGLDMAEVKAGAGEIIDSVKEVDGVVTATKRALVAADIPELAQSKITGLETALAGKQANLSFEGTYNASSNKVATKSYVDGAVDTAVKGLDYTDTAKTGEFVTAVTETDGIISVSRAALKATDIPTIQQSQVSGLSDALAAAGKTGTDAASAAEAAAKKHADDSIAAAIGGLDSAIAEETDKVVSGFSIVDGLIKTDSVKKVSLSQVAKTGNIDDLVQTANTYVHFDCGTASTVM